MSINNRINEIEKLLNKKIFDFKLLSDSFGIKCLKVITSDNKNNIVKFYENKNYTFNAIKAETENLLFFNNLKINYFPKIINNNDDYLVMSYIENDDLKPTITKNDFLDAVTCLHFFSNENYGFQFDTQIGGLKQKNNFTTNWVNFYRDERLNYIFELINSGEKMDKSINVKIEGLINNLENYIPKNPKISLLHGDLWEGNILFSNLKFSGFIDPGSFFGHNELEVAYLRWFNPSFIDNNFLEKYNDVIAIDKNYLTYEPIYQLYYSLLNVYLWDRNYIDDVIKLLEKIKI